MLSWKEYTKAIDVWSVGCIFAELLGKLTHEMLLLDRKISFVKHSIVPKNTTARTTEAAFHLLVPAFFLRELLRFHSRRLVGLFRSNACVRCARRQEAAVSWQRLYSSAQLDNWYASELGKDLFLLSAIFCIIHSSTRQTWSHAMLFIAPVAPGLVRLPKSQM
eukprot:2411762-Pleurochrysis_carterae.AAC.2